LDFARQSTPQRSRQDLNQLISTTASLMEPLAAKHHTQLELNLPESPLFADVDPAQIQQVLTNLVVNAIQTIRESGRVIISLTTTNTTPPGKPATDPCDCVCITIADNGAGIAPEDLEHIFEPFFTTKEVGEGTGLGLSISHGIIQEHQGWITVDSEPGRGSTFSIYLPADQANHDR
jgi:signal transduction histidine kinase